jgi:hypothetical protein
MRVRTDFGSLLWRICPDKKLASLQMHPPDCDRAVDMLKAQFDNASGGVVYIDNAWYSIYGGVVGFYDSCLGSLSAKGSSSRSPFPATGGITTTPLGTSGGCLRNSPRNVADMFQERMRSNLLSQFTVMAI